MIHAIYNGWSKTDSKALQEQLLLKVYILEFVCVDLRINLDQPCKARNCIAVGLTVMILISEDKN